LTVSTRPSPLLFVLTRVEAARIVNDVCLPFLAANGNVFGADEAHLYRHVSQRWGG